MRPLAGSAFHVDEAVVFLDDPVSNGQAQARPPALGREEGIEDAGHVIRRDAAPGVCDLEGDVILGQDGIPGGRCFARSDHACAYAKYTIFAHCIDGVEEEVDQRLFQEALVSIDDVILAALVGFQRDATSSQRCVHEPQCLFGHVFQRHRPQFGLRGPTELQELIYDGIDPVDLLLHELRECAAELRVSVTIAQKLRECLEGHQRVLDLVRHSRGERAEAGEMGGPPNLRLQLSHDRQITEHDERAEQRPIVALEGTASDTDGQ